MTTEGKAESDEIRERVRRENRERFTVQVLAVDVAFAVLVLVWLVLHLMGEVP